MKKKKKLLDKEKIEDLYLEYKFIISMVLAIITTIAYSKGVIVNVRDTIPNIITFASVVFVVIGFIITLLIMLEGSSIIDRIDKYYSEVKIAIYKYLYKTIIASIIVVIIAIGISVLPTWISCITKRVIALVAMSLS